MMAFVRGVIAAATNCGTITPFASQSTSTGVAPTARMAPTVAMKVLACVMTSSPGPISAARSASSSAESPESVPTASVTPQ
jgi:hypothetical protein